MLSGQIALVTGASRGVGRGIALQLGEAGATVYITALKPEDEDNVVKSVADKLPTLQDTADEIIKRGGHAIPIFCNHGNSVEVESLFKQIANEQNNRLDILISNAFPAVTLMLHVMHQKFWELPEDIYDRVNDVGLRGHYICARHAAKLMVPRRRGLIVTTSSPGGLNYIFNVAYGINKTGCDRLAADMAIELREHNIASVALWPGAVRTELFMNCGLLNRDYMKNPQLFDKNSESIEFAGKCVVALATDLNIMNKSGQILTDMQIAKEYNLTDNNGELPVDPLVEKHLPFLAQLNQIRSQISL